MPFAHAINIHAHNKSLNFILRSICGRQLLQCRIVILQYPADIRGGGGSVFVESCAAPLKSASHSLPLACPATSWPRVLFLPRTAACDHPSHPPRDHDAAHKILNKKRTREEAALHRRRPFIAALPPRCASSKLCFSLSISLLTRAPHSEICGPHL